MLNFRRYLFFWIYLRLFDINMPPADCCILWYLGTLFSCCIMMFLIWMNCWIGRQRWIVITWRMNEFRRFWSVAQLGGFEYSAHGGVKLTNLCQDWRHPSLVIRVVCWWPQGKVPCGFGGEIWSSLLRRLFVGVGEWILVLSGWRSALAYLFNNQKRPGHGGLGDSCMWVEEDPWIFVVWFGVILEEGEVAAALWVVGGGFHFHCGWSMERDEWWVMRCSLFWECVNNLPT